VGGRSGAAPLGAPRPRLDGDTRVHRFTVPAFTRPGTNEAPLEDLSGDGV
jgi:hypothetical protein